MKNTNKSHEESDSSSLTHLPDEMILQILTKLLDLKTLCICYLVSKRFASITLQIDTISFTAPNNNTPGEIYATGYHTKLFWSLLNGVVMKPINLIRRFIAPGSKPLPVIISSFYGDSFRSAVSFLSKFRGVKFLYIELPCSSHRGVDNNSCLFKWKVEFGKRVESFLFISPNAVYDTNELDFVSDNNEYMEPSIDLFRRKVHVAFQCLKDVIVRHRMLLYFMKDLPVLENVCITDSAKRGTLCLSGGKVAEVREWIHSGSGDVKQELNRIEVPINVSQCFVPELKLPVSGYVMKGVTLVVMRMNDVEDGNECFMDGNGGFEDRLEAAYSEAVAEILENHKDEMRRLL